KIGYRGATCILPLPTLPGGSRRLWRRFGGLWHRQWDVRAAVLLHAEGRIGDDPGRFARIQEVRVEHEVVKEWVLEVAAEIGFEVASPTAVFLADEVERGAFVQALELVDAFHPRFQRSDQAHVDDMVQGAGDEVGAAADQDHVAVLGEGY